jgi:phospholipid/cholesterol/gamma-HCH transport system substrate-binding protein
MLCVLNKNRIFATLNNLHYNMSNETKVGILAIVTIAIGIWGYMFLKGRNIMSREKIIYTEFDNVKKLEESSPVLLNGYQVGIVSSISMKDDDAHRVLVAMTLKRDIKVPKNAVAALVSDNVMGGPTLQLFFDKPCTGADCVESGDYLKGITRGFLNSVATPEEIDLYLSKFRGNVGPIMDSLDFSLRQNDSEIGKTLRNVQLTVANLQATTLSLNKLMAASATGIAGTVKHLEGITANLEASNAEIKATLANANAFSAQLKGLELQKTVNGATDAMTSVKTTLSNTDKAIVDLNAIIAKIKAGEGSIGALLNDDKTAKQLNEVLMSVDRLSKDLTLHPKRYRSLLWGKERPYTPLKDDPQAVKLENKKN